MQRPSDDEVIGQLGSEKWRERLWAVRLLGQRRTAEAVPKLIEKLRDSRSYVQAAASWALGEIRDPAAIPALIENFMGKTYGLMEEDGAPHRFNRILAGAGIALAQFKLPEATEPIFEETAETIAKFKGDTTTLYTRVECIGYIGGERAYKLLKDLWVNPDFEDIQRTIAEGLGRCGIKAALPELVKALDSPKVMLRTRAAEALGLLGDTDAILPLIVRFTNAGQGLTPEPTTYFIELVRIASAQALGQMNTYVGNGALQLGLLSPSHRFAAAVGFAYAKNVGAQENLIPYAVSKNTNRWGLKQTAAEALAALDDPGALEALKTFEQHIELNNHPTVQFALNRWQGLV